MKKWGGVVSLLCTARPLFNVKCDEQRNNISRYREDVIKSVISFRVSVRGSRIEELRDQCLLLE